MKPLSRWLAQPTSVPDPKSLITDPDPEPQIENQKFRIRIFLYSRDSEKKFSILLYMKTQNG